MKKYLFITLLLLIISNILSAQSISLTDLDKFYLKNDDKHQYSIKISNYNVLDEFQKLVRFIQTNDDKKIVKIFEDKSSMFNSSPYDLLYPRLYAIKEKLRQPEITKWYESNFSNYKDLEKADLTQIFTKIIDKLPATATRKSELNALAANLAAITPGTGDRFGKICDALYGESITLGDLMDLSKSVYVSDDDRGTTPVSILYNRLYLQTLNVMWETDTWIFDTKNLAPADKEFYDYAMAAERGLFAAKYFFSKNQLNDPKYVSHIDGLPFYKLSETLLDALEFTDIGLEKLMELNVLNQLKMGGLKNLHKAFRKDEEGPSNIDIDYRIRYLINNFFYKDANTEISMAFESENKCLTENGIYNKFEAKTGRLIFDGTIIDTETPFLGLFDGKNTGLRQFWYGKIEREGTGYKIFTLEKSKEKTYSELSNEEKQNIPAAELAKLEQKERALIEDAQAEMKRRQNIDYFLKFCFRDNLNEFKNTIQLIATNYKSTVYKDENSKSDLNEIVAYLTTKKTTEEISKLTEDQQLALEDQKQELKTLETIKEYLLAGKYRIEYPFLKDSTLHYYTEIIDYYEKENKKTRQALGLLGSLFTIKWEIITEDAKKAKDPTKIAAAKAAFDKIFESNAKDINPSKTTLGGECNYSNANYENDGASMYISKNNQFYITGSISNVNTGNSITTSANGTIIKLPSGGYILKSDQGDFTMSFKQFNCGETFIDIYGTGKNSSINFRMNFNDF